MRAKVYIDKGRPLFACFPVTLSDKSVVWDISIGREQSGCEIIHCVNEKAAENAMILLVKALEIATGERPLVL